MNDSQRSQRFRQQRFYRQERRNNHNHENQNKNNQNIFSICNLLILFCVFAFIVLLLSSLSFNSNSDQQYQADESYYQIKKQQINQQFLQTYGNNINKNNKKQTPSKSTKSLKLKCVDSLPYLSSLSDLHPPETYYNWYGKVGKYQNGNRYQPGHVFQRHVAVNGECTYQQKSERKTVFLNLKQLTRALKKFVNFECDLQNFDKFQFFQDGKIYQQSQYIKGIDCATNQIQYFSQYFIMFKRAIQSSSPNQFQYMQSKFTTLWTFYPKRSSYNNNK